MKRKWMSKHHRHAATYAQLQRKIFSMYMFPFIKKFSLFAIVI